GAYHSFAPPPKCAKKRRRSPSRSKPKASSWTPCGCRLRLTTCSFTSTETAPRSSTRKNRQTRKPILQLSSADRPSARINYQTKCKLFPCEPVPIHLNSHRRMLFETQ